MSHNHYGHIAHLGTRAVRRLALAVLSISLALQPAAAAAELALNSLGWSVENIVDDDDAPFGLDQGPGAGEPRSVRGLALSPDGAYLYLGYNAHKQVRKIDLSVLDPADSCDNLAELYFGSACSAPGYGGACLTDSLDNPKAIATDDAGRVYVTRSSEIQIYDADLSALLLSITGFSTTNGIHVTRRDASSVFVYAADRGTDEIYRMVLNDTAIAGGGSVARAAVLDATFDGDGIVHVGLDSAGATTNDLRGLAVDVDGNVWAAENDGTLFHIVPAAGEGASVVTKRTLASAFDVAIDGDQVFVSSTGRTVTVIDRNDLNNTIATLSPPLASLDVAAKGSATGIDVLPGQALFVAIEDGSSLPVSGESSFSDANCDGADPNDYADDDNDPILVADVLDCPTSRYVAEGGDDVSGYNDCKDPNAPCASIQHAIDVACPAGDTINVASGAYNQTDITVDKPLTLSGDTSGACPGPGASAPEIVGSFTGSEKGFIIAPGVDDVTIEGFVVRDLGVSPQTEAGGACGVWAYGTSADPTERITVRNNAFSAIGWAHVFFYNEAQSAFSDIDVSCNTIDIGTVNPNGYGANLYGVECTNCVNSTISDNEISGGDIGILMTAQNGSGRTMTAGNNIIEANTVSGSEYTNIYATPFSVGGPNPTLENVTISGNHLSNSSRSILSFTHSTGVVNNLTITGNDITAVSPGADGSMVYISGVGGNSSFTGNSLLLSGTAPPSYFHAVDVLGGTTGNWTIEQNWMAAEDPGAASAAVNLRDSIPGSATVSVGCNRIEGWANGILSASSSPSANDNAIAGNLVGLDATAVPAPPLMDATGNYWGCAGGANSPGCDSAVGNADVTPSAATEPLCVTCAGAGGDSDNDGVCDPIDNCVDTANADQADSDDDTLGDACDTCPLDADNDIDADTVCGDIDNCPDDPNTDQADADEDGIGDVCDDIELVGSITLSRVVLKTDLAKSSRLEGRVRISGVVVNAGDGAQFATDLTVNGDVVLDLSAGAYTASIELGLCEERANGKAIKCTNGDVKALFKLIQQEGSFFPGDYTMSVKLGNHDAVDSPAGPVSVTLSQPTIAFDRIDDISACKANKKGTRLVCEEG